MRHDRKTYIAALVTASVLLALPAYAQVDLGLEYAQDIGLQNFDIRTVVANVIRSLLGLVGLLMVVQIMWGGFLMMTHGGNEEKRAEALAVIKNSIIGLFIVMSSTAIAKFVVDSVSNAAGNYI